MRVAVSILSVMKTVEKCFSESCWLLPCKIIVLTFFLYEDMISVPKTPLTLAKCTYMYSVFNQ